MAARRWQRSLPLVLGMLGACGESKVKLDEVIVEERLGWIEESIPLCEKRAPGAATTRAAARELDRLAEMARFAARAERYAPLPGLRSAGSCGGDVSVTSEHKNGVTDYLITFATLCVNSDEGPLTIDGIVEAREEGNPTPNGPMIKALEVSTDGVLEVSQGGQISELTVDRVRTVYGNPATFAPDAPDEQHPDVFTVDRISAVYPNSGDREDYIRDVRIERTGGSPATIKILDGVLATAGEGRVDIRTADDDPVVVNIAGGDVTSGTVELIGAGGSVVEVSVSPGEFGVIEITLNGEPYPSDLDCGAAQDPLLEVGFTLLTLLPIH